MSPVTEYIEYLWETGRPKPEASDTLAAIMKHHIPWSWKLVKTWQDRLGWLLVLGFSAFLRTSELINLQQKDAMPTTGQPNEAVLFFESTNSTKRTFLPLNKVVVHDKIALQALKRLLTGLAARDTLSQLTNYAFRKLWKDLLHELKLEGCGYMPYSIRRGAATSAYKEGVSLDVLVTKGRWQHIPTARIYLDQGLQSWGQFQLPPQALPRLARARSKFLSVSQEGARGREARLKRKMV